MAEEELEILWDVVPQSSAVTMIDIREDDKMIKALRKKDKTIQPVQLEVGDIVNTKVGVAFTRKSDDFLDSMMSGKLDQEIAEMQRLYPRCFFVIDKSLSQIINQVFSRYRKKKHRLALYSGLIGFIASCNARDPPIPIQFLDSKGILADVVVRTIEKLGDGKDRRVQSYIRPRPSCKNREIHILIGFEGISRKRAIRLLDHFGSLRATLEGIYALLVSEDVRRYLGVGEAVIEKVITVLEGDVYQRFKQVENNKE